MELQVSSASCRAAALPCEARPAACDGPAMGLVLGSKLEQHMRSLQINFSCPRSSRPTSQNASLNCTRLGWRRLASRRSSFSASALQHMRASQNG